MKLFRIVLEFEAEPNDDLEVFVEGLTALDAFKDAVTARIELVEIFEEDTDHADNDT